jgi:hypothetical protein
LDYNIFLIGKRKVAREMQPYFKKVLKNETRGINPINKKDGESTKKKKIKIIQLILKINKNHIKNR